MPIYLNTEGFQYYAYNMCFVAVTITLTRYMFMMKHVWFAYLTPVKLFLCILCIPLFLYAVDGMYEFQRFLDEEGLPQLVSGYRADKHDSIIAFIRNEYVFFGVATVILSVVFPIRMIISIWRTRNSGTV